MVDTIHLEASYTKNNYFRAGVSNTLHYLPNSEEIKGGYIRPNNLITLNFKPGRVYLNIEAPQVLHGNNLTPSLLKTKRDFQDLEKAVLEVCRLSGFNVKLEQITRLDTARDLNTLHPFEDYGAVFNSLNANYMKPNTENKKFGSTWFNWQNSTRSITSYCKSSQGKNKGYLIPFDNVMRTEARLLKSRVIREQSGGFLGRFEDLLKEGLEDCLSLVYSNNVKGLFRYDYEEYRKLIEGLSLGIIEGVLRDSKRGGVNPYYKAFSILGLSKLDLSREEALRLFYDAIDNMVIKAVNYETWKDKRKKAREGINALYNDFVKYSSRRGLSNVTLYTELREGFLMVA